MISFIVSALKSGVRYVREHPNVLLVLVLLLISPLLLWYTNQQYLQAGKENQDRLQKERVGLMQDVLMSLLYATDFDPSVAQRELVRIGELNPDIDELSVVKTEGQDIIPIAALDTETIGQPVENPQYYRNALVNLNDSLIFEAVEDDGRRWYTYRTVLIESGETYFIYTKLSLAAIDATFKNNNRTANWSFVYLYAFIIALAYWHLKMNDYRYLYTQVRKANEMKDLFTNMIAHELRAPLTAIRGYASMVEEKTDGEPKEYSRRVRESSERMIALVNDFLDVARIQSGKLSVQKELVNVSSLVQKVIDELLVSGNEKSVTLTSEGVTEAHLIYGDSKRLQQALTNLVSNAIKYTNEGTISISVEEKFENVEIRVKDTGMGIASEDQQKLFAPFFRVASEDVSSITGTGLGMWITKQLIELMNGHIAVESIKGIGTHVVVTFKKADLRSSH